MFTEGMTFVFADYRYNRDVSKRHFLLSIFFAITIFTAIEFSLEFVYGGNKTNTILSDWTDSVDFFEIGVFSMNIANFFPKIANSESQFCRNIYSMCNVVFLISLISSVIRYSRKAIIFNYFG